MTVEKMLNKFGNSIYITGADGWESPVFSAFIQPLRYKNKLYMTGDVTPIGSNNNNVYLYIGPADHDLTKLDKTYRIHDSDNNSYLIDRAEKIKVKNNIVYIWAVIRQTTEGKK